MVRITAKDLDSEILRRAKERDVEPVEHINDYPHRMKYAPNLRIAKPTVHVGQMKLFANELQFLNKLSEDELENAVIVYAGSSPSNKLKLLMDCYPQVKYILVDPNETFIYVSSDYTQKQRAPHYGRTDWVGYLGTLQDNRYPHRGIKCINTLVKSGGKYSVRNVQRDQYLAKEYSVEAVRKAVELWRVTIIEDFMTDDLARVLSTALRYKIYFWSDIRTNDGTNTLGNITIPSDLDILWNSSQMYNWIRIMKPARWMLKFRVPFFDTPLEDMEKKYEVVKRDMNNGIDWIGNHKKKKFQFLKGRAYLQVFAGPNSMESRLVGSGTELCYWDVHKYEEQFFYYNNVQRPYILHKNPMARVIACFDLAGDSALLAQILIECESRTSIPAAEVLKQLNAITIGRICSRADAVGHHFQETTPQSIKYRREKAIEHFKRETRKLDL